MQKLITWREYQEEKKKQKRTSPQNTSIQALAKRVLLDYQFDSVSLEDAAELAIRCLELYGEKWQSTP